MNDHSKGESDREERPEGATATDEEPDLVVDLCRTFMTHQAGRSGGCLCEHCARLAGRIVVLLERALMTFPYLVAAFHRDESRDEWPSSLLAELSADGSRLQARWPCAVCDGRLAQCATCEPYSALELSSDRLALALAFARLMRFRPTQPTSLMDRELSALVMASDAFLLMTATGPVHQDTGTNPAMAGANRPTALGRHRRRPASDHKEKRRGKERETDGSVSNTP
jgi:hypothetical protein